MSRRIGEVPRKVVQRWKKRWDEAGRRYLALRATWQDGTRQEMGIGYRTEEEADREAASLLLTGRQLGEERSSPSSVTVDVVLAEYLANIERRFGYSSTHAHNRRAHIGHLNELLGDKKVATISTAKLRDYCHDRKRQVNRVGGLPKRSTIFDELKTLRAAWRYAIDEDLVDLAPLQLPQKKTLPEDARPARSLDEDEVRALIASAEAIPRHGDKIGSLVAFMAWSGRRPVAIFNLRDDQVDLEQGRAYFSRDKGGEARGWSPLTQAAAEVLAGRLEVRRGKGWLWPTRQHNAYTLPFWRESYWDRIRDGSGVLDVQPYDLRRFACTRIVEGCRGNLKLAVRFTGHRDEKTLLRYLQPVGELEAAKRIGWTPEVVEIKRRQG